MEEGETRSKVAWVSSCDQCGMYTANLLECHDVHGLLQSILHMQYKKQLCACMRMCVPCRFIYKIRVDIKQK